ncbi:hypothetical protein [Clostridium sp. YIM B02555]|nr:hypothetical protein [Clostridium sp. YIM B02555]
MKNSIMIGNYVNLIETLKNRYEKKPKVALRYANNYCKSQMG